MSINQPQWPNNQQTCHSIHQSINQPIDHWSTYMLCTAEGRDAAALFVNELPRHRFLHYLLDLPRTKETSFQQLISIPLSQKVKMKLQNTEIFQSYKTTIGRTSVTPKKTTSYMYFLTSSRYFLYCTLTTNVYCFLWFYINCKDHFHVSSYETEVLH